MKIVFTGGGTAGHIFPIIAIVREMKKIHPEKDLRLFYIGPKDEYSLTLLSQEGVKIKLIFTGKLRRYFSFKNFLDLVKIPVGIFQALFWLFVLAPDLVFSKGGYGSFPTVFAANILRIPIFLHESDSVPGLASKIESKWALEIFTSFEKSEYFPKEKIICVGNPIRKEILEGDIE
ncbi:MAG: UDP-N-acetylglucosamine--N-acetylmuramyl-(pentapeptide) pyrophosphoryl-undecaprenol N-acetylglucosamine transferase, partial [Candidatus Nealsonbacteria bacterium]